MDMAGLRSDGVRITVERPLHMPRRASDSADLKLDLDPHGVAGRWPVTDNQLLDAALHIGWLVGRLSVIVWDTTCFDGGGDYFTVRFVIRGTTGAA